jgi:hypothetical protein
MQAKIDDLVLFHPSQDSLDLIDQICENDDTSDDDDDDDKNNDNNFSVTFMIILDRYYEQLDPNYLIGEDRLLYNNLVNRYPKTKLAHIKNVTHNLGDGSSPARDELYLGHNLIAGIRQILYQSNRVTEGDTPGHIISNESEYNDQTYDQIATTNITVIVGCK